MLSTHPGAMQRRIWRVLHSATPCEIRDGMDFYPGAHGLCRAFSSIYDLPISSIAGIYAALSPMNTWHTNVANVLDILRLHDQATVNTTHSNRLKAVRIANGEDPAIILKGRKVRAFWQAISNPSDSSPIPVDRHLLCLALGIKIGSNIELRSTLGSSALYAKVESAYRYLGEREGVGNRLASIAWFVQRRISSAQLPLMSAPDLLCCGDLMTSHGSSYLTRTGRSRRFRCPRCRLTRTVTYPDPARPPRRSDHPAEYLVKAQEEIGSLAASQSLQHHAICPTWQIVQDLNGNGHFPALPISTDSRSRRRVVYLGKGHPYANRGGVVQLSRFLVMDALGRRLGTDEHVDHVDRDRRNDCLENYRVLLAENHNGHQVGRKIEYSATIAEWSEDEGRFVEYEEPKT